MLHIERTEASAVDVDLRSMGEEDNVVPPSMLYNVLPTVVSNRIPTIPSIRRSLGDIRSRGSHVKSSSVVEIPQPETPPPGYTSRPTSGCITPHLISVALGEAGFDFPDDASDRPSSSRSAQPSLFATHGINTGISWKYASQGISLTSQAYREASAPLLENDDSSTTLTRQLYMHGVSYLLRGLPADLSREETLSLQAAIPECLAGVQSCSNAHALVSVSPQTTSPQRTGPQDATTLHRVTATIVFQTFILIQFLLPYVRLFLSHTYQFERRHQVTKRLVNTGVTTVDELSRKSLQLSRSICQMNDGKVGQAIDEMTLWWLRGITGGVQQGLEEGLTAIRSKPEYSRQRETGGGVG